MRYFTHISKTPMHRTWGMLSKGVSEALKNSSPSAFVFEHLRETVEAAYSGSLDVNQENFNHRAYEFQAKLNSSRNANSAYGPNRREVHITSDVEMEDGKAPKGTISESKVAGTFEEAFDIVESEMTLREVVEFMVEHRFDIIKNTALDPIVCLRSSLQGSVEATENMNTITSFSDEYRDTFVDILQASAKMDDQGETLLKMLDSVVDDEVTF